MRTQDGCDVLASQLRESSFGGDTPPLLFRVARAAGWLWIALLAFPLSALLNARVSTVHLVLALVGLALFVGAFSTLMFRIGTRMRPRVAYTFVATMFVIAFAMTAADRADWASMFMYPAGAAAMWLVLPHRSALLVVVACVLSAVGLVAAWQPEASAIVSTATTAGGICILMLCFGQLRRRNLELVRARDEIGRLAVAEERLRFARDLHDLLGHSLSVIALKAELAGRLLERDVDAAAVHVDELEQVARTALAEVRDAASGYRQPLLGSELDGARLALEAAGVQLSVQRAEATLPPEVEALLAWTVREGTTNVIRHSAARSCHVAIEPGLASATAEIRDDGRCAPADGAAGGHGLAGLRERAERLGGRVEAGPHPDGGFCLRVTVPTARLAAPRVAQQRPATEAHGPTVGALA